MKLRTTPNQEVAGSNPTGGSICVRNPTTDGPRCWLLPSATSRSAASPHDSSFTLPHRIPCSILNIRYPACNGSDGASAVREETDAALARTTRAETSIEQEERLVEELEGLGISYLSRAAAVDVSATAPRSPQLLISEVLQQRNARVRSVIIALLLAQPRLWPEVQAVHGRLSGRTRQTLMLYYTAATFLQRLHAKRLEDRLGPSFERLPDLFGELLGVDSNLSPEAGLRTLAQTHSRLTGRNLNWEGTYRSVARQLLRRWRLEARWRS